MPDNMQFGEKLAKMEFPDIIYTKPSPEKGEEAKGYCRL